MPDTKMKKEIRLQPEQLAKLAVRLRQSVRANVYSVCREMFSAEVGESVFDDLKKHDAFKCELCDKWLFLVEKSSELDRCKECEGEEFDEDEWEEEY